MKIVASNPWISHGAVIAAVLVLAGVTREAYVKPRLKRLEALRAEERQVAAQVRDLHEGSREMREWAELHPGQSLLGSGARRLPPASDMVPDFLKAVVPIASRNHVSTTAIQPTGVVGQLTMTDAAGNATPCQTTELQLAVRGRYLELGQYLRDLEGMPQLVSVRPVAVRYVGSSYPELAAELSVRLYGTP